MANAVYSAAVKFLEKSLKSNDINSLKIRLSITKARVYIEAKDYAKAIALLGDIHNDENITSQQKNIVDELMSYVLHIQ